MTETITKQDFFSKLLVFWLGIFSFLIPLSFCFYTYDSAQIKITLFYTCSCGAFFIWLSSLVYRGESFFTKKNFYTFLPILIYAFYIFISYFFKPYKLVRLDSFAHEIFYLFLFFVVVFSCKEEDYKRILKYCFCGAWFVFGYGLLQLLNLDFLPWKNFFAGRVFSTLANPNLLGSYALFMSVLIFFSYLIERQKNLIILFILAMINLISSQSKGSFLAFALCVLVACLLFVYFFMDGYKKHKKKIFIVSLILFIFSAATISYLGTKRFESFSFRLSTWRATFDMVKASPLTGTGIGSFEIIYPAYKRPEIFYIEKQHNIASQHAENYYLEQLSCLGIFGFGLFLWVLWYIAKQVLFKIKEFSADNRKKAFLLAGLSLASLTIYIHNFVDVSIYFASTSFFLILFNGAIFKLAFGPFEKRDIILKKENIAIFKIVFIFALLILLGIYFYIQKNFWTEFFISHQNTLLQMFYSISFIIISTAILGLFIYLMAKAKKAVVCLYMILAGGFYLLFWWQFISGVNFSRATALAERRQSEALGFYTKAIKQNPTLYQAWNFRGLNLFNRFSLVEKRDIAAGDGQEVSNDFKRSLRDFNKAKALAPNIALLDYNIASLYIKYAENIVNINEREKLYLQAEERLKYALLLDPAYDNIYFQLANIELARGNRTKAIAWLEEYLQGPKEIKNQQYLQTHKENQKALAALKQVKGY
ncbi:MAG: O-antigen ligase family protein [Elusimicrobiaceae bacterium]|nr:O-antigen ligase family protein [Elusimicrobiaceae bacterium]